MANDRASGLLSCPAPLASDETIQLAHGGGGRLMQQLLERLVLPAFSNPALNTRHDGAVLTVDSPRLAFTTDSFVVHPLFFPGGDIGELAVHGTVNDLAMCGARPLYLSAGLILEEGLSMETLRRILDSMRRAAEAAGVVLVTGDTKVVDRGKGDGVFINTAGIGATETALEIGPAAVRPGDAVLVSGDLGRHGISILSVREGLEFAGEMRSDSAPLWDPVRALLDAGIEVHCFRDLTRGGLSSALNEISAACSLGIDVSEERIPVEDAVRGACEILGLDPLHVANEGRFAAFLPSKDSAKALAVLRDVPVSAGAAVVGEVVADHPGEVVLKTSIGGNRLLEMLSGEQLPRIC